MTINVRSHTGFPGENYFGLHQFMHGQLVALGARTPILFGSEHVRFSRLAVIRGMISDWGAQIASRSSVPPEELVKWSLRVDDTAANLVWKRAKESARDLLEGYNWDYGEGPPTLTALQIDRAYRRAGVPAKPMGRYKEHVGGRKIKVPEDLSPFVFEAANALNQGVAFAREMPGFFTESNRNWRPDVARIIPGLPKGVRKLIEDWDEFWCPEIDVENDFNSRCDRLYANARFWAKNHRPDLRYLFA